MGIKGFKSLINSLTDDSKPTNTIFYMNNICIPDQSFQISDLVSALRNVYNGSYMQ